MRIGELAKLAEVPTSKIRFYERKGLLDAAPRGQNGYREYGPRDAKIIAFIQRASRLGFPLKEIRTYLSIAKRGPSQSVLVGRLQDKLHEMDEHLRDVRAKRREIVKLIQELSERSPVLGQ